MSLTVTVLKRGHNGGGLAQNLVDILFDSSYAFGGEVLGGNECGVPSLLALMDTNSGVSDGGYKFKYNVATGKLQVFRGAGVPISVYAQADIKGSANTDSENADAASLPTNGALLKAADTFANYTSPIGTITSPDIGRNVGIFITNDSGGNLNLFQGVTTYTITGLFRGVAQTDTVTFTSTVGNKVVATAKFRYKYGVKPFDSITSVAYDNAADATLKLSVGIGSKIGLPSPTANNVEADLIKLRKNAADLAITGLYSTNQTVNFGTLADADDISIEYSVATGQEVSNAFDLSAITLRALAIG